MANFIYTVYLPGLQKTVRLTELCYTTFKQLVKIITNDNNALIAEAFDDIVRQHCLDDVTNCTAFDKLLILLTIRSVCISPVLEVVVTCPETKEAFNCNIELSDLKTKIEQIEILKETKSYDHITLTYGTPTSIYIPKIIDSLHNVIHSVTVGNITTTDVQPLVEKLPSTILRDAKEFVERVNTQLSSIDLVAFVSPYASRSKPITITANVFNESVLEFLKLCFRRDLMSIYEHEYFLMNQFRMHYDDLAHTTPAEVAIYINLFKDEQKERERMEKKDSGTPLKPH